MTSLNYLGPLGLISLFLIKNGNPSLSGISIFEVVDVNKDGIVTEEEGMTNPNKAVVKEWVSLVENIRKYVVDGGITHKEFYDLSSPDGNSHNRRDRKDGNRGTSIY